MQSIIRRTFCVLPLPRPPSTIPHSKHLKPHYRVAKDDDMAGGWQYSGVNLSTLSTINCIASDQWAGRRFVGFIRCGRRKLPIINMGTIIWRRAVCLDDVLVGDLPVDDDATLANPIWVAAFCNTSRKASVLKEGVRLAGGPCRSLFLAQW